MEKTKTDVAYTWKGASHLRKLLLGRRRPALRFFGASSRRLLRFACSTFRVPPSELKNGCRLRLPAREGLPHGDPRPTRIPAICHVPVPLVRRSAFDVGCSMFPRNPLSSFSEICVHLWLAFAGFKFEV